MDNGRFGRVGAVVFSILLVASLLAMSGVGATATVSPVPEVESPLDEEAAPPADPPGQPGFGVLVGGLALLVAVLVAWRSSGRQGDRWRSRGGR